MVDSSAVHPFANPPKKCDLIMKGGITSGVVFPQAICELAREYRFVCIGGTSAGAIGAVMAAAAEYCRRKNIDDPAKQGAGFDRIAAMPAALAANLPTFFQPSKETRPLFDIGMAAIRTQGSKARAALRQTLWVFRREAMKGAILGLLVLAVSIATDNIAGLLLGLLLALMGAAAVVGHALYKAVTITIPQHDFGLCSGLTQPNNSKPGFTDWITGEIQAVAGRKTTDDPLTIGDLDEEDIQVASVTTDLSSRRPYELPFGSDVFCFRRSEFELLFPDWIMNYLLRVSRELPVVAYGGARDFYQLPEKKALPVAMIARMSLSFPGLIRAVPLYRYDQSLLTSGEKLQLAPVRCLFSDGGITSNFPIHLFDSLLPGRPTFGISLASYDPKRHDRRVHMPNTREGGADDTDRTPILPVGGLLGFVSAILSTARNWQDTLQSQLHGYSERIVEIRLDDSKEGGLNLDMDERTIKTLTDLGKEAGGTIRQNFHFNEHRWRRAATALPTLAQSLRKLHERYGAAPGPDLNDLDPEVLDYAAILSSYQPTAFVDRPMVTRERLKALAEKLAAIGAKIPKEAEASATTQKANLRITASMETSAPAPPVEPAAAPRKS